MPEAINEPHNADIHHNGEINDNLIVQNLPEVELNGENVVIEPNEPLDLLLESIKKNL